MPVVTDGGRGVGVDVLATDYPLVNPSADVRGLLADFYLAHEVRDAVLPLRLAWLHGFCRAQSSCGSEGSQPSEASEPSHEADLLVKDAADRVVFDSTAAPVFRSKAWGDRFRLYEWQTATAVCRALVHAGTNDAEDVRVYPVELVPAAAVLDERASEVVPVRVTTITVNDEVLDDGVEFLLGYNIDMAASTPAAGGSRRARTRVLVTAEPGGGVGRFPGCEEPDLVIRRINGAGPAAGGAFALSATGCYWLERPVVSQGATAVVTAATLRLNNNCGPCCDCADYENTYHGVRRLYERFKDLGRRAETARGVFRDNIDRWLADRECRKNNPARVSGAAGPQGYLGVAASFCNADDDCKYGVELRLVFVHNRGKAGAVVPCSTTVSLGSGGTERKEPAGEWPELTNYWEAVDPARAVIFRTRLKFTKPAPGDSVTITVTPYVGGEPRAGAETTVALYPCGV